MLSLNMLKISSIKKYFGFRRVAKSKISSVFLGVKTQFKLPEDILDFTF